MGRYPVACCGEYSLEGEEGLAIFDISSWRDWDSDDKIQLAISGGPVILKDMSEVKLLNSENADEDSIYNYALSLAGSEDRIFNHSEKVVTIHTPKVK